MAALLTWSVFLAWTKGAGCWAVEIVWSEVMRRREGLQLIGFRVPGGVGEERDWRVVIKGVAILNDQRGRQQE